METENNVAIVSTHNLHEKSAQEVFDFIVAHLRKQGKAALQKDHCAYRTSDGLSCAAGCLIPDDVYNVSFEERRWDTLVAHEMVPRDHKSLISSMQSSHDDNLKHDGVNSWEDRVKEIAHNFDLTYTPPITPTP